MDLSKRNLQGELMDDPLLDPRLHAEALLGLKRINQFTNSYHALWKSIRKLSATDGTPLRILDVACGGGDSLRAIARFAERAGVAVHVTGLDISSTAIDIARSECANLPFKTDWIVGDAIYAPLPEGQDVVFCSLFLHHLTNEQAVLLLQNMKRSARRMVLVADLVRSRLGYVMAYAGTRILSRSKIVHIDGPRSVEAAFTIEEMQELAQSAGMRTATIHPFWPERFLLAWEANTNLALNTVCNKAVLQGQTKVVYES
jgi:2-polyprenyl-3-methyl-5-hydroxy-6-metoxy-1,4-benzoquinol methylase